jgi:hypothetical protein
VGRLRRADIGPGEPSIKITNRTRPAIRRGGFLHWRRIMLEVYRYRDLAGVGITWSRTCLNMWEKQGRFPRRVPYGKQTAWKRADIDSWLAAQRAI